MRRMQLTLDGNRLREAVSELEHSSSVQDTEHYACLLRSCGKNRDLTRGRQLHSLIQKTQHHRLTYLSNLLIEMYGKCGSLEDARSVFNALEDRNPYSWNIMIAAYALHGHLLEAKNLYARMPNKTAVSCNVLIVAYARRGDLLEASKHFESCTERTIVSWNSMINAYISNGQVDEARSLFDRMQERDVISWTTILAAYAQMGELKEAKVMFDEMPEKNIVTWNAMVAAYAKEKKLEEAASCFEMMPQRDLVSWTSMIPNNKLEKSKEIFDSMPEWDEAAWNAIISAYTSSGRLEEAEELFALMPTKDGVSWNSMLSGYVQSGELDRAVEIFERMPCIDRVSWTLMMNGYAQSGLLKEARHMFDSSPEKDAVSWKCMLSGYTQIGDVSGARSLFNEMPEKSISAWNILLAAYSRAGGLRFTKAFFDAMPEHDLVSWNTLMGGFSQEGLHKEAIETFIQMELMGLPVDGISFATAIDACSESMDVENGLKIHEQAFQSGFQSQTSVCNAVVSMHGRFGNVEAAKQVFDDMSDRDIISHNSMIWAFAQSGMITEAWRVFESMKLRDTITWNSIIFGFSQSGDSERAMGLFRLMDLEGVPATSITFVIMADVCASLASLQQARLLHRLISESGLQVGFVQVANALINMYGKCGSMKDARLVFDDSLEKSDCISWNTMLSCYAQYGSGHDALSFFGTMMLQGMTPDEITFVVVLSVCAHAGLVKKGLEYFWSVTEDFGLERIADYYVCMVDALARAGQLSQAEELIQTMPFSPNSAVWLSLLASSSHHGDKQRGFRAAAVATKLDPSDSSSYVLVSNIYKQKR